MNQIKDLKDFSFVLKHMGNLMQVKNLKLNIDEMNFGASDLSL